jgi:hypothetical protein
VSGFLASALDMEKAGNRMVDRQSDAALRAEKCAAVLSVADAASRSLGRALYRVGPRTSRLSSAIREDIQNGHGM